MPNHPRISKATKERVNRLAKELSYSPNLVAKSLKTNKTKTIGLITAEITDPFYPEIVKGAEDIANKYGLTIILCNSNHSSNRLYKHLHILIGKRVDGVLIFPTGKKTPIIQFLNKKNIPFVLLDTEPSIQLKSNCVYCDQEYRLFIEEISEDSTEYWVKFSKARGGLWC